jgi:hypothetical protein
MFAVSVTRSPLTTVPLGALLTVTVGVLAATVTLTGVSVVSVSAGFGPPLVAVTLNWAV